jgi:hypothetical protein
VHLSLRLLPTAAAASCLGTRFGSSAAFFQLFKGHVSFHQFAFPAELHSPLPFSFPSEMYTDASPLRCKNPTQRGFSVSAYAVSKQKSYAFFCFSAQMPC